MSDQEHDDDPRPKPQYGELAPEGWTWTPPEDHDRLDTSRGADTEEPDGQSDPDVPSRTDGAYHAAPGWPAGPDHAAHDVHRGPIQYGAHPDAGGPANASRGRVAPYWNRPITLLLILIGIFGALFTISTLAAVPQSMQLVYNSEKLGTYHAPATLSSLILAGQVVQGVIWAASLAVSLLLMTRRRLSFYVPLIAGGIAAIVFIVFIIAIIATDPTLMKTYSGS
jgi:hypothetical protein